MRYQSNRLTIGLPIAALALLGLSDGSASDDQPLRGEILEIVSSEQGVTSHNLRLSAMEPMAFPLAGITLYQAKVVDTKTGDLYGLVVDQEGNVQSLELVRELEREARDALYGRLAPSLYDELATMEDSDVLTVAVWLKTEGVSTIERSDVQPSRAAIETGTGALLTSKSGKKAPVSQQEKSQPDKDEAAAAKVAAIRKEQASQREAIVATRQENGDDLSTQMAALQRPLIDRLQALGFAPSYLSPVSPLVYVELPKWAIQQMASWDIIETVYGPNENFDLMNSAKPTQKADVVDVWGFDGTGIDVAILEDSRIEFSNPYLNAGTTRVPGDPNVDQHATATAGMVASQHATYQGIAQGVNLFSANATSYADANLSAAMDWAAITQNVDVINNSWGGNAGVTTLNDHDRHLDYIVRNLWSTVTVAAGNENDGCGSGTGRVTSPARGYNMISAGNYADQNTLTWTDDAMDACSSYVNPSTGIEKPEVAAVGNSITSTTHVSPWIGSVGSGTSYAAPMVAGQAALLMDRNSSLQVYPEAVKAISMATALNNIEGSSRLSSYDGAGGVDMRAAFAAVDGDWWGWSAVNSSSFPYSYYAYLIAGEVVRAAIVWDSNPASDYSTDPLQADIDLGVYDPSANYVTGSASVANSYEIVEFTAPVTGTYEFRIGAFTFTGTTEYIGFAFWPGHRRLTAYTPQVWSTPPVSGSYHKINAGSLWNAVGIRSPAGADYDIDLYQGSAFGDPNDHVWLEDSSMSTTVDYVVIDRNHAPSGNYYPEVTQWSGTGSYSIEWATWSADTGDADGTFGPYSMTTSQVVRVWDTYLSTGLRKYFAVKPVSGDADLGIGLFDSDPAASSTWYQGRSTNVANADSAGAGGSEFLNYENSGSGDWMGLVVFNNGATTTTSFNLYTDTTAPTGSLTINFGATYTNTTSVTLTQSASDAQTGVSDMRFSNNGTSWSSWQAYSTSKAWTLLSGDGTKTAYVQYGNNAGQSSGSYTDTIVLDATPPTNGTLTATPGDGVVGLSWSGFSDALSGLRSTNRYRVMRSTGGYPGSECSSGTQIYVGNSTAITAVGLSNGVTYYFRTCAYDNAGNISTGAIASATPFVPSYTLNVTKTGSGSGTVTSDPAGIDCGTDCSESYSEATVVTLTPTPHTGSYFVGWSGHVDCSDGVVTMDASKTCTATFNLLSYTLNVTKTGSGSGTVTSDPAGINCGMDCSQAYTYGTAVILTETASDGSAFAGWGGHADCSDGVVTMTGSRACTARFELLVDSDSDGVPDESDNCVDVANPSQTDSNLDGYGNACDPDYTNDEVVGVPDFNAFRAAFGTGVGDPGYNPDCDHSEPPDDVVGIPDFNTLRGYFGGAPGPSGLACAGTVPCLGVVGDWTWLYDWGCDGSPGSTSLAIYADGTWLGGSNTGTWTLVGDQIALYFDPPFAAVYWGTVDPGYDYISGAMQSGYQTGCWEANRVSPPMDVEGPDHGQAEEGLDISGR